MHENNTSYRRLILWIVCYCILMLPASDLSRLALYPVSKEIDYAERWASSYADNGEVGWTNATSANGTLAVSFPDIR